MVHTVLIVIHAVSGSVAFVAGCVAVRRPAVFRLYLGSLVVMASTLGLAVAEEWGRIDEVSRVVFSGLVGLSLVMLWRADRARRLDAAEGTDAAVRRFDHIGFTLVSLFAAYIVIQVRSLGAPLWLVLGAVAVASLAGHFTLMAVKGRIFRLSGATSSSE